MLSKTVKIGDKDVKFKCSAAIPRMYRVKFKRDIFKDLSRLEKAMQENEGNQEASTMQIDDLEMFENVAYIMNLHADPTVPDNIDDWLEQFDMFSIYEILPEILELWGANLVSTAESKKNKPPQKGK